MINIQTYVLLGVQDSKYHINNQIPAPTAAQRIPQSPKIVSHASEETHSQPSKTSPVPVESVPTRSLSTLLRRIRSRQRTPYKMEKLTGGKSAQQMQMATEQSPMEIFARKAADFGSIEDKLDVQRFSLQEAFGLDKLSGKLLGQHNPFAKKANPRENIVWLFDNTAYRPIHPYQHEPQPWQAEFVASYFKQGRKEAGAIVSNIADLIGLDGKIGEGTAAGRKTIEERSEPFIHAIAPARSVDVTLPIPNKSGVDEPHVLNLGPANSNGISGQVLLTGGSEELNGKTITVTSVGDVFPLCRGRMRFAGPEGWGIISDIDDTIKITQTVDPIGILKSTFVDDPKTTSGMPEFYKILDEQFQNPAWFYLSASPYNLYPFLHKFINEKYLPGTIILRDSSWMFLGGLLQSLTQGVKPYKVDRMNKIHSWLPKRKMICIGDSTQMDPESYAEIYKKYPGWIQAIYIRRVTDAPHMDEKNKEERFAKAFEGVDPHIWKVFTEPEELADHVKHLAGTAHMGVVGALQGYFCKQEQAIQRA